MAFLIVQGSHLEKDEIIRVGHTIQKHKFQMEQRLFINLNHFIPER